MGGIRVRIRVMSRKRYTVVPRTLCFVFKGNQVLLLKASDEKDWSGMYDPIGGHIEKGEAIIESARREIKEESGLEISELQLKGIVHVSNFFGKNVMLFVVAGNYLIGDLTSSEEGDPEWVDVANLNNVKVFEDVEPIIRKILSLKPGEIFVGTSEFDGKDKLVSLDIRIN